MTAGPLEREWDSEDSHRHQNRSEAGCEALDYLLGGNDEDARRSVSGLDDTDLEALQKALYNLYATCAGVLGRRHS